MLYYKKKLRKQGHLSFGLLSLLSKPLKNQIWCNLVEAQINAGLTGHMANTASCKPIPLIVWKRIF